MNDQSVIVGQNENRTRQARIDQLKAQGYVVLAERVLGIIGIGPTIMAYGTVAEAKAAALGQDGDWYIA